MWHSYLSFALVALTLVYGTFAAERNSPPTGALTVGPAGKYKTISAAVAAASKGNSIFIYGGTYNEAVYITVDNLTVYGQTDECVIFIFGQSFSCLSDITQSTLSYNSNTVSIKYNGAKATKGNDDASGTLRVHANSFAMYNVNVTNTYGIGSQALALSAYGTQQVCTAHARRCPFYDTLSSQGFLRLLFRWLPGYNSY
jgi:pectinesterase